MVYVDFPPDIILPILRGFFFWELDLSTVFGLELEFGGGRMIGVLGR
jgi:hypothetical protein